jgi:acetylxylan esterase
MSGRRGSSVATRVGRLLACSLVASVAVWGGAAALQVAPAFAVASSNSPCASVDIISARGSTEKEGPGKIGAVAEEVQKAVKATVATRAVKYPAALSPYEPSVVKGDEATKAELEEEVTKCPGQRILLLGYSQGAQIVGDALGGGGGNAKADGAGDGKESPPAAKSATEKVVGVIQYGDPRRIPGQSFDVGTDPGAEGIFPRKQNQLLTAFAPDIQSYCDTGDPFCAKGNNLSAHLDYFEKYDKKASQFLVGRLKAVGIE